MTSIKNIVYLAAGLVLFASCKKTQSITLSKPAFQIGQAVSDSITLTGSIKGTMLTGKTYTLGANVVVNQGDTLYLQPGVKVNVNSNAILIVKGTFISAGTSAQPNVITPLTAKTDIPTADPLTDPAFAGKWYGINCDTTCALFVMKYTHVEGSGATFSSAPLAGLAPNTPSWAIFFQNPNGLFILEDSWIYGTTDDAVRVTYGKVNIMRNTFEKTGQYSGEGLNVKSGTVGNIAYNLFIGSATNGTKISNAGLTPTECNVKVYNNTYIDCGFRQTSTSPHGGSINIEKGAEGSLFNNLTVNCKKGLRVVGGSSAADTSNVHNGNNFYYGDSAVIVNNFYPVGDVTHYQTTDVPTPSTYLPIGYILGAVYAPTINIISVNSGLFKNFTLPNYNYQSYTYTAGFDFHLAANSPAIGKGSTTAVVPFSNVPVDPIYGSAGITPPGSDAGCYQSNGTGNQH
jgi:hypothetical protein